MYAFNSEHHQDIMC